MPLKDYIASDARTFLSTLFGNREPITERDFTPNEIQNIRNAIAASQVRTGNVTGRGAVKYADYPEGEQVGPGYEPIKTTLGRFAYIPQPNGGYRVVDRYDFLNDERKANVERYEQMSPMRRNIEAPLRSALYFLTLKPNAAAGELGDAFIGREGRDVNLNIPPVNKATGGLAQYKECSCGR